MKKQLLTFLSIFSLVSMMGLPGLMAAKAAKKSKAPASNAAAQDQQTAAQQPAAQQPDATGQTPAQGTNDSTQTPPEQSTNTTQPPAQQPAAPAKTKPASVNQQSNPSAAPHGNAAAAVANSTGTAKSDDLDVTVTGEAKDEVPIVKDPPSLEVPFPDVTTLAREGQTDRVLAEPVQHMTPDQQVKLIELDSHQTVSPAMVKIAAPPFFRTEMPAPLAKFFSGDATKSATWEYQVVDQNNHVVHSAQGSEWPTKLLEWDGFDKSNMVIKVGPSYNPKIIVRQANDKVQQFFGDAIQLGAMMYTQDGLTHIEFSNDRLYERGLSDFSSDMELSIKAALDAMRLRVGTPLRILVYESPSNNALAKKRLDKWKALIQEKLMISTDDVTLLTMPPTDRGNITAIMMLEKP